jgi:hypothetical protein
MRGEYVILIVVAGTLLGGFIGAVLGERVGTWLGRMWWG